MRTTEIKIYSFDELSEEAKQFALAKYLENEYFDWIYHDAEKTVNVFCSKTNISTSRDSWIEPSFNTINDGILYLSGVRLMSYFYNNYDFLFKKRFRKSFDGHKTHRNIVNKTAEHTGKQYCFYYSSIFIDDTCCNLTGVCYDGSLLKPIYEFLNNPDDRTFKDIIEECFQSLKNDIESEIEDYSTIESFSEHCDANNYEFLENGKRYY